MVFSVYDDKTSVKLVKLTRVIGVTVPVKFAYKPARTIFNSLARVTLARG